ncbi:hypothetical protein OS188_11025 [Xanthomarina sp. F1114]|nr:hypothetical protein [Xanthomarina sp. F1114]MCX7548483.1 hypothetical protein [Xanthomarina sp. F1114]
MKNVVRILLLIVLVFIASKVLFSDFHLSKSESKTITMTIAE